MQGRIILDAHHLCFSSSQADDKTVKVLVFDIQIMHGENLGAVKLQFLYLLKILLIYNVRNHETVI